MTAGQFLLTALGTRYVVARGSTRHGTYAVWAGRQALLFCTGCTWLPTFVAAFRVAAMDITRSVTRGTGTLPMAVGFTYVGTCRQFPSTFLLAYTMINIRGRVLTNNARLALALTVVATWQIGGALDFAFIICKRHIDIAMDNNLMFTIRNNLVDRFMAADGRKVLVLPARQIRLQMATRKDPVCFENIDVTPGWAWISTLLHAWVVAPLSRPQAWLRTINSVVKQFRMTFLYTSMTAGKAVDTSQIAAPFW